jgi:hypothetical protein
MNSFERMPALFIGHGNPMNAVEDTEFARAWKSIGASLRRPKAVLAISAHWYVEGTFVTAMDNPRTIHDFGGFPPALHDVRYPAPGDPELASRVQRLASRASVLPDTSWGLDHGAWSVLRRLFPDADVPVVQLSLDEGQPPAFHHELGRELRALREEGVLVLGDELAERGAVPVVPSGDGRHQPQVGLDESVARRVVAEPSPTSGQRALFRLAEQRQFQDSVEVQGIQCIQAQQVPFHKGNAVGAEGWRTTHHRTMFEQQRMPI